MFISRSLCLLPSKLRTLNKQFRQACKLVFPKDRTGVKNRRNEVTAFLQAVEQFVGDNYEDHDDDDNTDDGDNENGEDGEDHEDEDEIASQALVHAPVHDVESIFWLIVLFFLRACPKDYNPKSDPRERKRRQRRTDAFDSLVKNKIGTIRDSRGTLVTKALPPQLHCFVDMLDRLDDYFSQVWHRLGIDEGPHRFHAHNALQSVLLKEIKKLQARKTEIEINPIPLGVDDNPALIPSVAILLWHQTRSPRWCQRQLKSEEAEGEA